MNSNDLKIIVQGSAYLTELYRRKDDLECHVVLLFEAEAEGSHRAPESKITYEVRISEEQYASLKKKFDQSKAERPSLRVNGTLELILE